MAGIVNKYIIVTGAFGGATAVQNPMSIFIRALQSLGGLQPNLKDCDFNVSQNSTTGAFYLIGAAGVTPLTVGQIAVDNRILIEMELGDKNDALLAKIVQLEREYSGSRQIATKTAAVAVADTLNSITVPVIGAITVGRAMGSVLNTEIIADLLAGGVVVDDAVVTFNDGVSFVLELVNPSVAGVYINATSMNTTVGVSTTNSVFVIS